MSEKKIILKVLKMLRFFVFGSYAAAMDRTTLLDLLNDQQEKLKRLKEPRNVVVPLPRLPKSAEGILLTRPEIDDLEGHCFGKDDLEELADEMDAWVKTLRDAISENGTKIRRTEANIVALKVQLTDAPDKPPEFPAIPPVAK